MLQPEQGWRGHSRGIPLEYLQVFKQVLLPLVSQERLREGPSFCQEGSSRRKSVLRLLALLLSNKLTCCVCFGPWSTTSITLNRSVQEPTVISGSGCHVGSDDCPNAGLYAPVQSWLMNAQSE